MKRLFGNLFLIVFTCLAVTSCNNKKNIASLIPSDALVVTYFDTKSFFDKLPYDSIKATELFKDIVTDSSLSELTKKILNDPDQSGIDLNDGMALFVSKGEDENYNVVFSGFIADKSDFETFNKSLDSGAALSKEQNRNILVIRNTAVVGWNNNQFAYVLNVSNPKEKLENIRDRQIKLPEENSDHVAAAQAFINKLFSLSASASLASESRFNTLIKQTGEMKVWINPEKIIQISSMGALGMLQLDAVVKESRTTYAVNFDNGKIIATQKSYYNKEMTALIKKYTGEKVKPEDFAAIPSTDVLAAMRINFKPEGIMAFLKLAGLDGFVNMFAGELKVSSDDLVNSLAGTITGSLSDLKIPSFSNKGTSKSDVTILDPNTSKPIPQVNSNFSSGADFNALLSIGIRDKAVLQKLVDGLSEAFMGDDMPADKLPFTLTDREFVISNNKNFTNKYVEAHSGSNPQWADKASGHPFGFYLDINKILQALPAASDTPAGESRAISLSFWKNIYATGGDFSGDALSVNSEVNLTDTQRNSLRQLNTYIDALYKINKQKIGNWERKTAEKNANSDHISQNDATDSAAALEK